jgi:ABC-type multidrug transport system fused ATPase/permease subunit
MTLLRRLLALTPGLPGRLLALVAVLLAVSVSYVLQAILIARAVAGVIRGGGVAVVALPLAAALGLIALRALLLFVRGRVALQATGRATSALRQALAARLFDLGPRWTNARGTGVLQSLLVDGVEAMEPFLGRFIPQCAVTLLGAVGISALAATLDPGVGLVILSCSVVAPLVPMLAWHFIREPTERWQRSYRGLYAANLDALLGMSTLKILDASERHSETLGRQASEFCRQSTRVIALWGPPSGVVALLVALGSAVAVGLGALHAAQGALGAEDLLLLLLLAREGFRPVKDLENAYHDSWSFRSGAAELLALLDAEPSVRSGHSVVQRGPAGPALAFEDVSFWYGAPSRPALDRFSLTIEPGERVALVGRSGAGKTTVVSLLLRLIDPSRGRILLDGRDLRELDLSELRAAVAVVSQETHLFHGTILDNLRVARPAASDAQIDAAARAARVHDFVADLPERYRTPIGERGMRLSGGERQRISIARALLKDAPILVLDEATSHVDAESEAAIQSALQALPGDRLTLVIAHRLSTVRHLDRVVLMERGGVLEQGSHTLLLERRGAYARLAAAQGLGERGIALEAS